MALPSWWQVVTPHKDILKGKLSEALFAADLGDVVNGGAPLEYQDARMFFQKTYLTSGLTNLLENVSARLSGGDGDPVIQLQTPFGGGKTHALLALYHLINNRESASQLVSLSSLPHPKARVAVFVGTHADPLKGKTPWGEIADQLGLYRIVEEHDKKRVSPGKQRLAEILKKSGPTLVLMDEILEYIVKANRAERVERITHGQTLAFLQELSEVVIAVPNCCLVMTLPSSILERYDEDAEKSLQQLQKVIGRVETVYTPVEGNEIYEVLRKRLFEDLGDEKVRRQIADWHFNLYQKLGTDVPPEVKEVEYRNRMVRAYPFHPELIDVLYERWGSYPTFQRTRGVLRLMAEVVADLYSKKGALPLIQSSQVNLDNQAIRREFVKHIGNEYDSVISADIAGSNAKAPKIDKEMGSEYSKYGISKGIATSIFLYSFSGGERRETSLPRVRVALLREGIPVTIVGDAVSKLEQELWYLHSEKKQYAFRNQPNLNRVIVDKEETIAKDRIESKLKETIQSHVGKEMETYLWPEQSSDIPDNRELKLAILSPAYTSEKAKKLASEVFSSSGMGFRVYKNTLFVLSLGDNVYVNLKRAITRHLALGDIQKSADLMSRLTKPSIDELKDKLKEVEKGLPFNICNAYRQLTVSGQDGIEWKDLGMPTLDSQSLSQAVMQKLVEDERILSGVTAKYLVERTFRPEDKEKSLREAYEILLKTPGLSIPENQTVFLSSVRKAVEEGALGLKRNGELYFNRSVAPNIDDVLLRREYALELAKAGGSVATPPTGTATGGGTKVGGDTPKGKGTVRRLTLRAVIPWDKLSQLISGVIHPLQKGGNPPKITVEIEASSEEGFDRTTLDTKVKETLTQIGGTVEEWKEEES